MIDISKERSSIVRLVKAGEGTEIYQVDDKFLKSAAPLSGSNMFRQKMFEILRFNPFICEAFYADEVILIEGPTEEIIIRGYLQEHSYSRFVFPLNCGTVNNIPFYQKVLGQFRISYSVICDADSAVQIGTDGSGNPEFESGIQKSISDQFKEDKKHGVAKLLRCHFKTFELAHRADTVPTHLQMRNSSTFGKPYDANKDWEDIIRPNLGSSDIQEVPIIQHLRAILKDN